jgi:hypothetical protein
LWDARNISSPGWDRGDVGGDLWYRPAGGALEIVIARFVDDVTIMRLHVAKSYRRPPIGTIELGSRGVSVLSAQAASGNAELLCSVR